MRISQRMTAFLSIACFMVFSACSGVSAPAENIPYRLLIKEVQEVKSSYLTTGFAFKDPEAKKYFNEISDNLDFMEAQIEMFEEYEGMDLSGKDRAMLKEEVVLTLELCEKYADDAKNKNYFHQDKLGAMATTPEQKERLNKAYAEMKSFFSKARAQLDPLRKVYK